MVLLDALVSLFGVGGDQQRPKVEGVGLIVERRHLEPRDVADQFVQGAHAEGRHVLTHLVGDELEEVLHELRSPGEAFAQHRILGRDADGTGVEVTDAHHDAARDHEWCGGESELLRAEHRGDDDVATRLELTVDLHDHPAAQSVGRQRLVGLGQAELPRGARVLERRQRRGAGAPVVSRDQDHVGVRLGDAGGDGADALLGHELDVDARLVVGVLEVVDQLGEVLDRIDVVVRRR